jgi:predicted ATPase/DNA-binding SARP family transcriptional activator
MVRDPRSSPSQRGVDTVACLDISALGPLQIERDGSPLSEPLYAKVLALLVFLAVESDRPHQRASLAALLWPDQPEARARHSLRQALSTLRRVTGADSSPVVVARDTVYFDRGADHHVDAIELTALLDACDRHDHADPSTCAPCHSRREHAVALYRGELLDGFAIPDSDTFENWVQVWRQRYRDRVLEALDAVIAWHERLGQTDRAIAAARRQLELDPWLEPAYRRLMWLHWQSGNRTAALAQYERCRRLLDEELGVEPEPETTALHDRIRDGAEPPDRAAPARPEPAGRLPAPPGRLVGRERELEQIADLLGQRGCRLLTLVGPGGIGKTRLAIQVATDRAAQGDGDIAFASLSPVRDTEGALLAMAEALGLTLQGTGKPMQQLAEWLRDRTTLLVLDSAEHLTAELQLLGELLSAAPGLTVLVTSRERLQLAAEWVYEIRGMSVPASDETDAFEGYDAVDLLTERLRQVRSGAPLRHDERPAVVRICRLASGFPLAIELAVAWAGTLPLDRIATEIQQNLDFLTATARDRPDRHTSMRAVFASSWDMLAPDERAAWRRLSVFTGGFRLDAARAIAGTDITTLASLINKSLVTRASPERYTLHELLGQFGGDLLRQTPEEYRDVHEHHARYFLAALAAREEALTGRDQQAALAEIEDSIGNIRSAWSWAVASGMVDDLIAAAPSLWLYFVIRGGMREGAATFGQMLAALEDRYGNGSGECRRALAIAQVSTGGFRSGLGHYDEAIALLRQGIATLRELTTGRELGLALNMLAAALIMKGEYEEARASLRESRAESERAGDRWGMAFALNDLGMVSHLHFGDTDAWRHCERSRAIFRQLGDARGQAFAAHNLGVIALERGAHRRAMLLHREAMALRAESDDRWGLASSLVQMGVVSRAMGDSAAARRELVRALRIAWESSIVPVVLEALVELLSLERDGASLEHPDTALAALAAHPALPDRLRPRLESLMDAAGIEPAGPDPDATANRWAMRAVDELARQALAIPATA